MVVSMSASTRQSFAPGGAESRLAALLGEAEATTGAHGRSVLARFLYSPGWLLFVGLTSWAVLGGGLGLCGWLGCPGLALCLTVILVSVGFASSVLAVLDGQRPLLRQWQHLLLAVACWAVVGLDCLWLF